MRFCVTPAFTLLLVASPLLAADDPLDAFPAETGVVLRIGAPSETSGKVKGFLNNAAPRYAQLSDSLGPALGSLIGNPTLAGIDPKRDWYVAVLPRPEKSPSIVFAVPTANADEMKKAIGKTYTFADFESWTIYSLDAEAVGKVSSADRTGSFRTTLTDRVRKVFDEGEIAIVLNVPSLRNTYQARINTAKEQIVKAATQVPPGSEATPAMKMGQEYNRKMIEELMKVVEDSKAIAENVSISGDALRFDAIAVVEAESGSAKFLAKQSPSELPLLQKLPGGRLAYYDMAGDFSRLMTMSAQMTLAAYPMNEKLQALVKDLANVKFRELAGAFELGDLESGVIRGVSLIDVESPEDYRKLARQMVEAMATSETAGIKQEMSITPDAETIEGVKVDLMRAVVAPAPGNEAAGAAKGVMEIMFGKEGMTQRFAVVDGLFVQGIGEPGVMANAIKSVRGNGQSDAAALKAAATTRERLDDKANVLVLFDLPRLMGGAIQLAVESKRVPLPIDPEAIENLNLAPSYAGLTIAAEQDAARFRTLIPAEQVRGVVELVNVLQKAAPKRDPAN
ncbi:MAG: hypothetical protein M3552_20270 [Planctomycetota bacterium]|nr:hypothetical protein [Planctomycetaceae bacterium]MDQ3332954.1 hypothetical protein [Planctomycetota bacterium]